MRLARGTTWLASFPGVDDDSFPLYVAGRLAGLPAVEAVTLGGSRAEGTHRPDSDWDFSIYYRGRFDPQTLRDIGWPGEVFEVGGWSKGVFNGGAWLEIDGRKTDVHYRDLDVVDREIAASREGRFDIEPLLFHLAGIPSYLVLAELSVKRVLHGNCPRPSTRRRCANGHRASGGAGPSSRSATLARTTLGTVGSPSAPGSSPRRRRRRPTRCWPRAASGSPTRRRWSPGRACARSMSSSPPRAGTRPC